jgi:phthalate 4,5-dioxygenase oxygenase subunit
MNEVDNRDLTRVSAGTVMGELIRRYWVPVFLKNELPFPGCPPVRVTILGELLVGFRDGHGQVGLIEEFCAHRNVSLFLGAVEDCGLRCAYHGWKYDSTGQCIETPNEPPESRFRENVKLTAYPCEERGGIIWAYMGPAELKPALPEFEFAMVPDDHRFTSKRHGETNFFQPIEGNIDNSHVGILHSDLYGSVPLPGMTPVWAADQGGADEVMTGILGDKGTDQSVLGPAHLFVEPTAAGVMVGSRRARPDGDYYWRFNQFMMPFYCFIAPIDPTDRRISVQINVPVDDENTWTWAIDYCPDRPFTSDEIEYYRTGGSIQPVLIPGTFIAKQNRSNGYLQSRELQRAGNLSGVATIAMQDGAVQESMGAITDRTRERLGSSDAGVVAARETALDAARALANDGIEPPAVDPVDQRLRAASVFLTEEVDWSETWRLLCEVSPAT